MSVGKTCLGPVKRPADRYFGGFQGHCTRLQGRCPAYGSLGRCRWPKKTVVLLPPVRPRGDIAQFRSTLPSAFGAQGLNAPRNPRDSTSCPFGRHRHGKKPPLVVGRRLEHPARPAAYWAFWSRIAAATSWGCQLGTGPACPGWKPDPHGNSSWDTEQRGIADTGQASDQPPFEDVEAGHSWT